MCRLIASLLLALFLGLGTASASISPEGPRLAFISWGPNPHRLELLSIGPDGRGVERISGGLKQALDHSPVPFQRTAWSPDGSLIAFAGYFTASKTEIFVAAPDGSDLRAVPNTVEGESPVFAPDGRSLAFARSRYRKPHIDPHDPLKSINSGYSSATAWTVGLDGEGARRLTGWRDGFYSVPSSISPDGTTLAMSRQWPGGRDAVLLNLETGRSSLLAHHAEEPTYSPDGAHIAFVSYRDRNVDPHGGFDGAVVTSELYVKDLGGGQLSRVTHTHDQQENSPGWDPSGERLAYTQSTGKDLFGLGLTNVVMEINADGTCPTRVYGKPAKPSYHRLVGLYGPAWQPGPGREAGRSAC